MKILVDVAIEPAALKRLQALGFSGIDCMTPPSETAREVSADRIREVEILFCSNPPINFEEMRALKWIQVTSAGYSQLFDRNLPERGIRATNSLGCFDTSIAEWNIAMMINLARDLRQMIRNQDSAVWDRSAVFQREIRGLTLGIWGYGGIGRETARLARQLGLNVHVLTRKGVQARLQTYQLPGTGDPEGVLPDRQFVSGQEQEFLRELDFLVLAMPLTKMTEGLVGERELLAMKSTAFVLNPARGPIIQQRALLKALREKWIAGAALDTHYQYPMPPDHPLWKFPNVIFTPHISGSLLGPYARQRMWEIFSMNLERFTHGEPMLNELTHAQLAGL